MIVKKIVKWLRNRGYDDFYLADLADKYEGVLFFFVFVLQCIVICGLLSVLDSLLPKSFVEMFFPEGENISGILSVVGIVILVSIFSPPILLATIKNEKRKGETELRIMYIISSNVSKIGLKLIRNAPVISAVILAASLIYTLIHYGFYYRILAEFSLRLLLLLLIFRPYQKLLSRVIKEASYYVEWKTHQIVDNFDERYSGYEIWRIPPSEMDFEKFNVWHFRNICKTAFVCVSVGCIAVFIYALSFSPISCMSSYDRGETEQTEELYEKPSSGETEEANLCHTDKEPEEPVKPEIKDTMIIDEGAEEMEPNKELPLVTKNNDEDEEEIVERKRYYNPSELDERPTMSDGSPLHIGVERYLKERFPVLENNSLAVNVYISPTGKIEGAVANGGDLRITDSLRKEMGESLLSMPNVVPGKKGGHTVHVLQYVHIDRY